MQKKKLYKKTKKPFSTKKSKKAEKIGKPEIAPEKILEIEKQDIELPKESIELEKSGLHEPAGKEIIEENEKATMPTVSDFQDQKNQLEALLFACGRYIEESELSQLSGLDKRTIRKALESLRNDYKSQKNSLAIFQEDKSWKINVREKYLSLVRKIVSETELSRSSMETLAVIAWKSPIFQSEVVKIRGNKCYDHIEDLVNFGYITKDKKGRSYVLRTTEKFFTYFDIDHKNLQGVLDAAKRPEPKETQSSLGEVKESEDKINIIETIKVRKKTESEEEKLSQQKFLHKIEEKISAVKEKNQEFAEELPRPQLQEAGQPLLGQENIGHIHSEDTVSENPEQQSIEEEKPKRPKSLTKKQLERKFKEELMRVREKMEKKEL